MTREEFWTEVYLASFKSNTYAQQAATDANDALAAYDEAFKECGEACKEGDLHEPKDEKKP